MGSPTRPLPTRRPARRKAGTLRRPQFRLSRPRILGKLFIPRSTGQEVAAPGCGAGPSRPPSGTRPGRPTRRTDRVATLPAASRPPMPPLGRASGPGEPACAERVGRPCVGPSRLSETAESARNKVPTRPRGELNSYHYSNLRPLVTFIITNSWTSKGQILHIGRTYPVL
jgi:hypothetical protein